ncbi:hypothetical protein ES703_111148 [subsurface metagenome]
MNIRALLQQTDFFAGISSKSGSALAGISIPKTVEKKKILFLEGQEGHSRYILAEGAIQLFKTAPDGRDIVIKLIQPGEIFAEVVLFEESHYPVSAVALKKSLVLMLPKLQVDCLLVNDSFRQDFR